MTAQVSDSVRYRQERYAIGGVDGQGLFDPQAYGFSPMGRTTACWRGYCCAYRVDDHLRLDELEIGLAPALLEATRRGEGPELFASRPEPGGMMCGNVLYKRMKAIIPFSGGLLLGRDFVQEMYVHMGFHPAYKYREVHELIFEEGKLVSAADRSAQMAEIRKKLAGKPLSPRGTDEAELERWVESTFSLRYKG